MNLNSGGVSPNPADRGICLFCDLDADVTGISEGPERLGFDGAERIYQGARKMIGVRTEVPALPHKIKNCFNIFVNMFRIVRKREYSD